MGDRLYASDGELKAWLAGASRGLRPPALCGIGLHSHRTRVAGAAAVSGLIAHTGSPARFRSRSKNVGTARSIAAPPEIPSQLTFTAPTSA